jgi:hypothetical protein
MNYEHQAHELVDAKTEHSWLKEVPGHCVQQALRDLDEACRQHGTFNVRWRSARRWLPSFRFPEGSKMEVEKLNRRTSRVKLPKLGWVTFRASRSLEGETIRSATLTREGEHWFVSFLVDDGITSPTEHASPAAAVGVDRGVAVAVATSSGAHCSCNANCRARPYGTPCQHEHACVRCPMLRMDPKQRARLAEIIRNLDERIKEARMNGWLGEVQGLQTSRDAAAKKLVALDRRIAQASREGAGSTNLGIPVVADTSSTMAPS